jgi:hypothetical protein
VPFLKKLKFLIPLVVFLVVTFTGVVKINMINTKALSERTAETQGMDLQKIKDEFGEEFSSFIVDSSNIKIHQRSNNKYLLEVNGDDYEVSGIFKIFNKINNSIEYLTNQIRTLFM